MNPYTLLLGLVGLILLWCAWRERQAGNPRDAWALSFCGVGLGTVAGVFALLFG